MGEDIAVENATTHPHTEHQSPFKASDISDLPFSMPKLARRLKAQHSSEPILGSLPPSLQTHNPQLNSSLKLPKRPSSGLQLCVPSLGVGGGTQGNTDTECPPVNTVGSLGASEGSSVGASVGSSVGRPPSAKYSKQARPTILVEPTEVPPTDPTTLQLKLPLQRPNLELCLPRVGSPAPSTGPGLATRRKPKLFLTPASLNLSQSRDVDTSIPLERQEWYHGMLSRVEGETVLKSHSEGSYLVRATADQGRTEYSLAIKSSRGFMHLRIQKEVRGDNSVSYKLGEFDRRFVSVVEMVRHYSINRLPIRGAEHMCLLTPVTEELL